MRVTDNVMTTERKKIHPHKFALWVAMGSILMMFAGLTSAYVVKKSAGNWRNYELPPIFWASTVAIMASSVTIWLALRAFRNREMPKYRVLVTTTLALGVLFGVLQYLGFLELYSQPQQVIMNGAAETGYAPVRVDGNPSESFLFIISGLHLLHIAGGIVALAIVFFRAFRKRVKTYSSTGLEIVSSYWHFVDLLWIYLFLFFLANQ
jgi:cytochrome c oxidase subunit 3